MFSSVCSHVLVITMVIITTIAVIVAVVSVVLSQAASAALRWGGEATERSTAGPETVEV